MSSMHGLNGKRNQRLAMNSLGPHHLPGSSLIAVKQEGIRLATAGGLLDAHLVKLLRVNYAPMPRRPLLSSRLMPGRQLPARLVSRINPQFKPGSPELAPPETKHMFEAKRLALRSISEVLTDQAGQLYELRGDGLYRLGELVTDEMGRIFEVCGSTKGEANRRRASNGIGLNGNALNSDLSAESTTRSSNLVSEIRNPRSQANSVQQSVPAAISDDRKTCPEPTSVGQTNAHSILIRLVNWIFGDRLHRLRALIANGK